MVKYEFECLLHRVIGGFISANCDTKIYYFPIHPKELTILCYSNDKREAMWVAEGWDVWRIYSDEDLTAQLNIIVEHYF